MSDPQTKSPLGPAAEPEASPSDGPPTYESTEGSAPPYRRTHPAPRHPPIKTATSGDTSVETILDTLKWGLFNGRPACLLSIKLLTTEPAKRSSLFSTRLVLSVSAPLQIVAQLPLRLAGPRVKPIAGGYAEEIGYGPTFSKNYSTLRSAWGLEAEVRGSKRAERSAAWEVTSNEQTLSPLPKELRLGIIVDCGDAEGKPFDLEIEVGAQSRSFLKSVMRPMGDKAKGTVRLKPEASGVVLTEAELKSCVSSMFS